MRVSTACLSFSGASIYPENGDACLSRFIVPAKACVSNFLEALPLLVSGMFAPEPACHASIFIHKSDEGNCVFGENLKYTSWDRAQLRPLIKMKIAS